MKRPLLRQGSYSIFLAQLQTGRKKCVQSPSFSRDLSLSPLRTSHPQAEMGWECAGAFLEESYLSLTNLPQHARACPVPEGFEQNNPRGRTKSPAGSGGIFFAQSSRTTESKERSLQNSKVRGRAISSMYGADDLFPPAYDFI